MKRVKPVPQIMTARHYERCSECGVLWAVERKNAAGNEFVCPRCKTDGTDHALRSMSDRDLSLLQRALERAMRATDADNPTNQKAYIQWQKIDKELATRAEMRAATRC